MMANALALALAGLALVSGVPQQERLEWRIMPGFRTTIALGTSFTTAEDGIITGGADGVGAQVYVTADGGACLCPGGALPPWPSIAWRTCLHPGAAR